MKHGSSLRPPSHTAFTLVELVLALGIFAFAISALMAIFPLALQGAATTRSQTYITAVARNLLEQIELGSYSEIDLLAEDSETVVTSVDPSLPAVVYLGFDQEGHLVRALQSAEYQQGDASLRFIGRFETYPINGQTLGLPPGAATPEDTQITLTIESPAAAPRSEREVEYFATRIRS